MNTNLMPNTSTKDGSKPVPWGKKYRTPLMNTAFWCFWIGFFLAHQGGVSNIDIMISLSYVVFALACLVPLVTKK